LPPRPPDRLSERDGLDDSLEDDLDKKKKPEDVFAKPKIGGSRQPAPFEDTKENQLPPPTPGADSLLREGSPEVVINPKTKMKILAEVENLYRLRSVQP